MAMKMIMMAATMSTTTNKQKEVIKANLLINDIFN